MAVWNLVDALSQSGGRRAFYLPVASIPPGQTQVRTVDPGAYDITQEVTNAADLSATTDIALKVTIHAPAGGFADENGLPDPSFRFHAIDSGFLRFKPATSQRKASLELSMATFMERKLKDLDTLQISWWNRWIDVGLIPLTFIYENVDVTALQTRLNALPLPPGNSNGVSLSPDITAATQAQFIQDFMNGIDGKFLHVDAGAVIGSADVSPTAAADKFAAFHVLYSVPATAAALPMNPRELFHLFFGNDSAEAGGVTGQTAHPLLARLQQLGTQSTDYPDTVRMLLRPPLRTSQRVDWEAHLEIDNFTDRWKEAGHLTRDSANNKNERLYNPFKRSGRTYNKGGTSGYKDSSKCNLFVWDIAIRSGFRACVQQVGTASWHYISANQSTNEVQSAPHANTDRIQLVGAKDPDKKAKGESIIWSEKIENMLRVQNLDIPLTLNNMIQNDGRVIVMTGGRASNNGHIVFVKELLAAPTFTTKHSGFKKINIKTLQASSIDGAVERDQEFQLGGTASSSGGSLAFVHLHLIELQPGGDPDTLQGLFNLNVLR